MKACIFDLDGTLTNTLNAIAHFGNLALEAYGFKPLPVMDYRHYVGDGRTLLIHRMLNAHNADTPENFQKVCQVYDEHYEADPMYDTNAYSGIPELLNELKQNNIKIAVCSNKPDNVVQDVVKIIFGDVFDIVCGVIDGEPTKPNPHTALKIAEKLGVAPEECLFIGDTNVDIFTAKNAGMTSVGVTWGFRDRHELIDAGAEYIVDLPSDILKIIEKL
ncbi:MAG: HAD family hydrolase [Clostridia bacterium]